MADLIIDYFSEVEVSEDGKSLLITAVFIDGTSSILAAPYLIHPLIFRRRSFATVGTNFD